MNWRQRMITWLQVQAPLLSGFLRQLIGYDNQIISLEYRVDNHKPRYGYARPALEPIAALIRAKRGEIEARIEGLIRYFPSLSDVPLSSWQNGWFPALDAISLYGFLRGLSPKTYLEIGSGHSTRFARRAITDGSLPTKIVSLDPHPRANVSELCDSIIRSRLEDSDLSAFDQLQAGDIVLFDGTHRSFVNSDVTVFFLEVLPRLARGIVVLIHDIYLPYDYPPGINFYNEQYLLATYMEAGGKLDLILPNAFISRDAELRSALDRAAGDALVPGVEMNGCSFCVTTT